MNSVRYEHISENNIFKSNGPFRFICTNGLAESTFSLQKISLTPEIIRKTQQINNTFSIKNIDIFPKE